MRGTYQIFGSRISYAGEQGHFNGMLRHLRSIRRIERFEKLPIALNNCDGKCLNDWISEKFLTNFEKLFAAQRAFEEIELRLNNRVSMVNTIGNINAKNRGCHRSRIKGKCFQLTQ